MTQASAPSLRLGDPGRTRRRLLLLNVGVVATCALLYELVAGTLASYLLGDAAFQFSLVIGTYLSAMGVGAAWSGRVSKGLARRFLEVELALAVVGGVSAPLLVLLEGRVPFFGALLFADVAVIGVLVGLELPLLLRLLEGELETKELLSRTFAADYAGALLGSLLFPFVLVRFLGVVRTSLLVGAVNAVVAGSGTLLLARELPRSRGLLVAASVVFAALLTGLCYAGRLTAFVGD